MSELNLVSPLLDGLTLLEQFSDRGRAACFYLERSETGEQFVVKHISIPESDANIQALILTGAVTDEAAANEYYRGLVEDIRSELDTLKAMPDFGLIDYQIEPREGVGFDVYMLMSRKIPLRVYLQDNAITQLQALNLGLDLCDALGELHSSGFAYLDLKPENVFVDSRKRFTIGDLGLMRLDGMQYSAVPEEYINEFSAPELSRLIPEPNALSDQYSLGMLLFYVFNGNHPPFDDGKISPERAREKRLESKILPSPQYADYELAEIISRACSLQPSNRYASFAELKQDLTLYMQRNEVSDQLLVPPLPEPEEAPEAEAKPEANSETEAEETSSPLEETAEVPEAAEEPVELPESEADEAPATAEEPAVNPEPAEESGEIFQSEAEKIPATVEEPEVNPEPAEESEEISQSEAEKNPATVEEPEKAPEPAEQSRKISENKDVPEEILIPEAEKVPAPAEQSADNRADEKELGEAMGPIEATDDETELIDLSDLNELDVSAEEPTETIEELLASVSNVLSEDEREPVAQAPDLEANEAAVNEPEMKKKKKKTWVPVVIALLILALLGAALFYFYNNWYIVKMEGIEVVDHTADSITVAYDLSTPDPGLTWTCVDSYGSPYTGTAGEGRVQFSNLQPEMLYTISFESGKLHKLVGDTSIVQMTEAETKIISMTAVQAAVNTTAEITIDVSGKKPSEWILTYSSTGSDSGSVPFSGNSVEVTGLQLHDTYTFELTSSEDIYLTGETSCQLQIAADVQAKDFQVASATADSLTLTWESTGDAPLSWNVQCVGDGYDETLEVTECVATFKDVHLDKAYTFTLSAQGMEVPMSISLPANARIVTSFKVEPLDAGTIHVSWNSSDTEGGWLVNYQIGGDPQLGGSVTETEEHDVYLTGMPANTEIVVSLVPKDGQGVIGVNSLTTETIEAAEFSDHEFTVQDSELTLYLKPEGEEWSVDDLGDSLTSFDPGTETAVVLQAPEEFKSEDTDDTIITLVIRSENGNVVGFDRASAPWNVMWPDGKYHTSIKLPNSAGSYQLELYFNGKLVNEKVISIEGAEETSEETSGEETEEETVDEE